jgi:hypothetical protein
LGAALLLALIFANVRSETATQKFAVSINIDRLTLDWRTYWGRPVAVKGAVQCESEDYCRFVGSRYLHRIIVIDIAMLPIESQYHVVFDCHDAPCTMVVIGDVGNDDFLADSVRNVDE